VPVFLKTGVYKKIKPSRKCLSNAMNVGHPSNLARIVDLYGGIMDHDGIIHEMPDMERLRADLDSYSISDNETRQIIADVYEKHKYILEAHGAVGWGGLMKFLERNQTNPKYPLITFETADPAKFPNEIKEILGIEPPMPPSLKAMQEKEENWVELSKEYKNFKNYLVKNY
ncbi:MAG: threonine synthase, partial [Promethearchaeota archaeon]